MSARCQMHGVAPALGFCNDCDAAEKLAEATRAFERAEQERWKAAHPEYEVELSADSTATQGVVFAVPPALAEIDRDREITCALIGEAGNIICHHDNEDSVSREIVADAKAFMSAWFKRKTPTLGMPIL